MVHNVVPVVEGALVVGAGNAVVGQAVVRAWPGGVDENVLRPAGGAGGGGGAQQRAASGMRPAGCELQAAFCGQAGRVLRGRLAALASARARQGRPAHPTLWADLEPASLLLGPGQPIRPGTASHPGAPLGHPARPLLPLRPLTSCRT